MFGSYEMSAESIAAMRISIRELGAWMEGAGFLGTIAKTLRWNKAHWPGKPRRFLAEALFRAHD